MTPHAAKFRHRFLLAMGLGSISLSLHTGCEPSPDEPREATIPLPKPVNKSVTKSVTTSVTKSYPSAQIPSQMHSSPRSRPFQHPSQPSQSPPKTGPIDRFRDTNSTTHHRSSSGSGWGPSAGLRWGDNQCRVETRPRPSLTVQGSHGPHRSFPTLSGTKDWT